jgi:rifampicin phosphotransferase
VEDRRPGAPLVDLQDPSALDPSVVGAKAEKLARAVQAGLPVLPAVVLTTAATEAGGARPEVLDAAWSAVRRAGAPSVVVRSSSTVEDAEASSMAGQFRSVLGVADRATFAAAVEGVIASAASPAAGTGGRPMAVLVQPEVEPVCGGVLFGLDPLTGEEGVLVLDAVRGSPSDVVGGTATAAHVVLGRRGGVRSWSGPPLGDVLPAARLRRLARLARRAAAVLGGPQDIEWAYDHDGRLWLLQSRPITAVGEPGRGPLLGPGPVAETFPEALAPLEVDLWVEPLREGLLAAIEVVGVVPPRRLRASPGVVAIRGRVAIDLDLVGAAPAKHPWLRRLAPAALLRRLVAAWRTGRLRAALPLLAGDLVAGVDAELLDLPPLGDLTDRQLLDLLEASREDLRALHGYEVLCGMLLPAAGDATAAGLALDALSETGSSRSSDEEVVADQPVVLLLAPPRVGGRHRLPTAVGPVGQAHRWDELSPREALRVRCRWVQELGARAAEEVGRRLEAAGRLPGPARVRDLALAELAAMVRGGDVALPREAFAPGPPVPTTFRLTASGSAVAATAGREAVGASAGRASGRVRHHAAALGDPAGSVLVVGALEPQLAGQLGRVAAIVSETGSQLSHLAILAREAGVPVAVGVTDARARFPEGSVVLVDGGTGTVALLAEDAA